MATSLWKMCLDTDSLPDLPEPGLRKNHAWDWGTWVMCHCLANNLTEHLIKGPVVK